MAAAAAPECRHTSEVGARQLPYLVVIKNVYKTQLSWLAQLLLPVQQTAVTITHLALPMNNSNRLADTESELILITGNKCL